MGTEHERPPMKTSNLVVNAHLLRRALLAYKAEMEHRSATYKQADESWPAHSCRIEAMKATDEIARLTRLAERAPSDGPAIAELAFPLGQ